MTPESFLSNFWGSLQNSVNPRFGTISTKVRTFAIVMFFTIPPNSACDGQLEEFCFFDKDTKNPNTLAITLLRKIGAFPDSRYLTVPKIPQHLLQGSLISLDNLFLFPIEKRMLYDATLPINLYQHILPNRKNRLTFSC